MRSGFPNVEKFFDLALLPIHDRPPKNSKVVSLFGIPTTITDEEIKEASHRLSQKLALETNGTGKRIALLVGGNSRRLRMKPRLMKDISRILLDVCSGSEGVDNQVKTKNGVCEILLATSRRTPRKVEEVLNNSLGDKSFAHLLWAKNYPENPIPGILGLSDLVLVTEDSFSMLMEAVHSGRPVICLRLKKRGLRSNKYETTIQSLEREGRVFRSSVRELKKMIEDLLNKNKNGFSKKVNNPERDLSVQAILQLVKS
jgi:hypothetical protein